MKEKMVKKVIFILFFLCLTRYTLADVNLSQEINTPEGIFISLPGNWIQIPKEILDDQVGQAPKSLKAGVHYAFQLENSERWFTYPYIIISIENSGRIPEADVEKFKKTIKLAMESVAKDYKKDFSFTISSLKAGEVIYDAESHILWSYTSSNINNIEIASVTAIILTENGIIQVSQYAKAADLSEYLPLFQVIPLEIRLSDSLKYKARLTGAVPTNSDSIWDKVYRVILMAIAGGIFGLIWAFFERKKKSS